MDSSRFSRRRRGGSCEESEDNEVAVEPDRLSELPESLILAILSLLPMKDVVQTTFLSKRWNNRWIAIPSLDFRHHSFDLHSFRSFVYGALVQWKGPKILKFAITSHHFLPRPIDLDFWLLFAIEKQVEELSLELGNLTDFDTEYFPPQHMYSCPWITHLSFSYSKLKIDKENVQWDGLKSLEIVGLDCLSADAMNKILCGAPLLEELIFAVREISEKEFSIRSTSLKTLCIGRQPYCHEIVKVFSGSVLSVWAPNLLNLTILGELHGGFLLDVPSLTSADLRLYECGDEIDSGDFSSFLALHKVFQSVRHVESVSLSSWCIKFLIYMKMKGVLLQFSNASSTLMNRPTRCLIFFTCFLSSCFSLLNSNTCREVTHSRLPQLPLSTI